MDDLRQTVAASYMASLGREPESAEVIDRHVASGSPSSIIQKIAGSEEALARHRAMIASPFFHYAAMFDAEGTIRRHARTGLRPDPACVTNFLGVRIEEAYLPHLLTGKAGMVEPIPIPSNWHADIAEWAAALRAVDLARGTFTVAELGWGWGCWLNNTGVAARNMGLSTRLIGVEGDKGHIQFAQRCCELNEFKPSEVRLLHGVASARNGMALFPKQAVSGADWGLGPIFGASGDEQRKAADSGQYDILPMISIDDVIGGSPILDLLHVDIQGGEADLVEQAADALARRVAYIVIGTHSREIEGRVMKAMSPNTWRLEIERPALVSLHEDGPLTRIDGVYGWRNMALRPA